MTRRTAAGVVALTAMTVVAAGSGWSAATDSAPVPRARIALADYEGAPGTAGLAPDVAWAYTAASTAARRDGVTMRITSGKRSWAEQRALWRDGIAQYGSAAAARRWVLPPGESTHVSGRAIDVGPRAGAQWLESNGSRWGLCRTFDNEWWHFELATVPGGMCPRRLPDAGAR